MSAMTKTASETVRGRDAGVAAGVEPEGASFKDIGFYAN
jgi:hypothetical protein